MDIDAKEGKGHPICIQLLDNKYIDTDYGKVKHLSLAGLLPPFSCALVPQQPQKVRPISRFNQRFGHCLKLGPIDEAHAVSHLFDATHL